SWLKTTMPHCGEYQRPSMFILAGADFFSERYATRAFSFLAYFSLSQLQELKEAMRTTALRVVASFFMTGKKTSEAHYREEKFQRRKMFNRIVRTMLIKMQVTIGKYNPEPPRSM